MSDDGKLLLLGVGATIVCLGACCGLPSWLYVYSLNLVAAHSDPSCACPEKQAPLHDTGNGTR